MRRYVDVMTQRRPRNYCVFGRNCDHVGRHFSGLMAGIKALYRPPTSA